LPITIAARHLPQEPELPVPDDRSGREHRGEQHGHGQHAREDERLEVHPGREVAPGERGQAGAEDQQEQQRLDERRNGPQPVPAESDHLAAPHDAHRAQVGAQAPLRHRDPDLGGQAFVRGRDPARLGGLGCHPHRLPRKRCAICRMWSVPDASASRMVVPV
jgi:hypothetical protein